MGIAFIFEVLGIMTVLTIIGYWAYVCDEKDKKKRLTDTKTI